MRPRTGTRRSTCSVRASAQPPADAGEWWSRLSKRSPQGPAPPQADPVPTSAEGWNELRMGTKGYRDFENAKRDERQRVWDAMRRAARRRYAAGEMPAWFRPAWLDIEEAPTNTFWRAAGNKHYQQDPRWLGGGDGGNDDDAASTSGGGGGGGGGSGKAGGGGGGGGWRWWREDDPYWPLRDWGDHPMRWWTLGFAALLAAGGVACGSAEGAAVGLGAGAALGLCGGAMSDMRGGEAGALAVKIAWATCLLLTAREYWWGWSHKRGRRARAPRLEGCGAAALAMAAMYMWTGMGGLAQYALPTNPGEAFKMSDVARKSKIWEQWGYGDVTLR